MELPSTPKLPSVGPAQFFREAVSELKKVEWPSRQDTLKLTIVVIALSVLVGAFIGGLDAVFLSLTSRIY
jgi:preprotein translocase subunit SecE